METKPTKQPDDSTGAANSALAESAGSDRWEQLAKYASVAELGAINANVMEYMRHWEQRAEKAESLARLLAEYGDPKPWKKNDWAWAKSQLHPADETLLARILAGV
jgi:hypothetical protein